MGRFVNPFTDVGFKVIFGSELSKDMLIFFLNGLLEGEYEVHTFPADLSAISLFHEGTSRMRCVI